jgi:Tfp pilus assembly protein PilZ
MPERRKHVRREVDLTVRFRTADGEWTGHCNDMGLGGAFIRTERAAPFGASITLHVELPGRPGVLELPAVVRWTERAGMGVQFAALGARVTYELTEYLATHEARPSYLPPEGG